MCHIECLKQTLGKIKHWGFIKTHIYFHRNKVKSLSMLNLNFARLCAAMEKTNDAIVYGEQVNC